MTAPAHRQIDPEPFREWAKGKFIEHRGETVGLGAFAKPSKFQFAASLGLDDRQLDRWMKENETLDRYAVEDALHLAGFQITDVYSPDELGPEPEPTDRDRGGVPPGTGSKLSDAQVYVLHRFHDERKVTVSDLARSIWKSQGFASQGSAEWSIRRAFKRLGLTVIHHGRNAAGARHCSDTNHLGEPCGAPPLPGHDVCWSHHPDNRETARQVALQNSPWAGAAA